MLAELTPRQSHILRLRFGLGGGEPHTLEEIANKFGLSRERIRQLEKEALRRLRHPQLAHNLRDYLGLERAGGPSQGKLSKQWGFGAFCMGRADIDRAT